MSLMWMPPQTTLPPLGERAQGRGHELAGWGEHERGVQLLGRRPEGVAGPFCAELQGEGLGLLVARAREREHAPALVDRDLADDVRGGAESVDPEALGVTGEPERPVADQPRAQQRGGLEILVAFRDREAVALVHPRVLGVPAVAVVAREPGLVAEVLAPGAAVATGSVGPA